MKFWLLIVLASVWLTGCTTPYAPPVLVKGAEPLSGIADFLSPEQPLEVVLVHGMCTHETSWAETAISELVHAVDSRIAKPAAVKSVNILQARPPQIEVVSRQVVVSGSAMNLNALIWSSLTTPLKQQLEFDKTGTPTDCANAQECKPKRAKLNGLLKDGLLNDCLADALIYQGKSQPVIQAAMVEALTTVLSKASPNANLAVVSDSLGSKIVFDALAAMLEQGRAGASVARNGLRQLFMNANQLPILGLADQVAPTITTLAAPRPTLDSLARLLAQVRPVIDEKSRHAPFTVVAFTDPNDLLSYRLMPSRYPSADIRFADVLVSNDKSYLGLISRPDTVHKKYLENPDVASIIACGYPRSEKCN